MLPALPALLAAAALAAPAPPAGSPDGADELPAARAAARGPARGAGAPATAPRPAPAPVPLAGRRRPPPADSLVVEKGLRRLTLWAGGVPARTYDVALGLAPAGPKERAGDRRTPEGLYHIEARHPASRYHRALRLSYPNADDRARARALGVTPGGDVMIHGLPNGQGRVGAAHRARDWTFGCVALTDDAVDELWAAVPVGTPVRITP